MNDKLKRIFKLFLGVTIAAFGIALVLNSDLGCFVETATNKGISINLGIPLFAAGMMCEAIMIAIATYYGEGLGWAAIVNGSYGAIMINIFHNILPHAKLLALGAVLIPIGWSLLEKSRFGATGSNILMKALMNKTGKSLLVIRTIIELVFLVAAYILASQYVTWFTLFLTFGTPVVMKYVYKLIGYKPTNINHDFIISKKI